MNTPISLESLVGPHVLTGVDTDLRESKYRAPDYIAFTLDGHTYLATEDPEDDYRSSMQSIELTDTPTKNTFVGVEVLGRMSSSGYPILELLNAKSGKVILEVGTDNADDYYPSWVARYSPENL